MDDEFHVDASLQDIMDIIDRTIREGFFEVLTSTIEQELAVPEGWQGFIGLRPILDEMPHWSNSGSSNYFTPEQFNRMWNGWSKETQIRYVIRLIT